MRKIDIEAQNNFNGDTIKLIRYYTENQKSLEEFVPELNSKEALELTKIAFEKGNETYGHDNFEKMLIKDMKLVNLNLTEEEVRSAEVNPYKAKIFKGFLKLLLIEGGILSMVFLGKNIGFDTYSLGILSQIATGVVSITIAENILKYFKFKNIKKYIEKNKDVFDNNKENEEKFMGGK